MTSTPETICEAFADANLAPPAGLHRNYLFAHCWGPFQKHDKPTSERFGLSFHFSRDGIGWKQMTPSGRFKPEFGSCFRDPCIKRNPVNGEFILAWTTDWNGSRLGIAHSRNLVDWKGARAVNIMERRNPVNTWAPSLQWCPEDALWYIFFTSSLLHGSPAYVGNRFWFATTKDFVAFTEPRMLFDWGFGVNDIVTYRLADGRYAMFYKCLLEHDIRLAFAPAITGPWLHSGRPLTPKSVFSEGPTCINIDGCYYLYTDRSREGTMSCLRSSALTSEHWEDITGSLTFPSDVKHGDVLQVEGAIIAGLSRC